MMDRSMKWFKMVLFPTKALYFRQLSAYSCTDGLKFFLVLLLISWRCYLLFTVSSFCWKEKNTIAKSFIFKLFKHCPDGMGAFKRHVHPEHDVHNKCMFDYDQLIFRLEGKSVSIDVSVNSLSNEKVLNNRKNILAIIDAIKLCGRLGIAL